MRRVLALLALVSCAGCNDFEGLLARCRDNGVWVCGAGVDGGGTDGGSDDGGVVERTNLVCQRGWCWESPRPFGGEVRAVSAGADGALWFGVGELLAHLEGDGGWTSTEIPGFNALSLCEAGDLVLAGGQSRTSASSLYVRRDGGWAPVDTDFFGVVRQLSCSGGRAFAASNLGVHGYEGGALVQQLATSSGGCSGVLAEGDGCLAACTDDGVQWRLLTCDGGVEFEDDAGHEARKLWRDGTGAARVAIAGSAGEVWRRDAGSWGVAATGVFDPYAGTAVGAGSLAVGQRLSWNMDTTGGVVMVHTSSTPYFFDVATDSSGVPWAVGSHGLMGRFVGGQWSLLTPTGRYVLNDVTFAGGVRAFGEEGLVLERGAGGWTERAATQPREVLAAWAEPSSGALTMLTASSLEVEGLAPLSFGADVASALFVFSRERALVATTGGLLEVELVGASSTEVDAHAFTSLAGDVVTGVGYAGNAMGVWASSGRSWAPVDGAPQQVVALDVAGSVLWAVTADGTIARRADSTWQRQSLATELTTVVALSATEALVFGAVSGSASSRVWRVQSRPNGLVSEELAEVPARVTRGRLHGDEVWVVGHDLAILRFSVR